MATNSATGVPDADRSDDTDAQVLRELEQMRTRIQELEARLKQRSGAQKSATETGASRPPMQDNFAAAPAPASVAASAQTQTESSNTQAKAPKAQPFAFADWTWLNGNARTKESPLDTKFFTPEIRADVDYIYDFNHPKDDTISGSSEVFRSNEIRHGIGVRARSRHLTCGG
jgi:glutamyl/glutaminyl-tRNA synthetase